MRKHLNWPLALSLVIGIPVLGGLVYALHEFQEDRNAGSLLNRAERAKNEGDMSEAIRLTRRYLYHRPDDLQQLRDLAIEIKGFYDEVRTNPRAHEEVDFHRLGMETLQILDLAVRKVHSDGELRRCVADFDMRIRGSWKDAREHLERIEALSKQEPPAAEFTPEDRLNLAHCKIASKEHWAVQEAVEDLHAMIGYDTIEADCIPDQAEAPQNLDVYITLARLYRVERFDKEMALRMVNEMVEANSEDPNAYLQRARFYNSLPEADQDKKKNNKQLVRDDIQKAVGLAPEDLDVILAAAQDYLTANELDQAEQLLNRALAEHPDSPLVYSGLAQWASRSRDSETALEYVETGLSKNPADPWLTWLKANIQLEHTELESDAEAFERTIKQLEKIGFNRLMIQYLRGRSEVESGQLAPATIRLEKLRPLLPVYANQIDSLLLKCYSQPGYTDRLYYTAERLLEHDPGNVAALEKQYQVLTQRGQYEEARVVLERMEYLMKGRATTDDTPLPNSIVLNKLQILIREIKKKPEEERDWKAVNDIVDKLMKSDSLSPLQKDILRVKMLVHKGKKREALEFINQALAREEEEYATNLQLWGLKLELSEGDQARDRTFREMQARIGDTVTMRLMKADQIVRRRSSDAAEQLRSLESNMERFSKAERHHLWDGLANQYLRLGLRNDTKRLWEKLAQDLPGNMQVKLSKFDLAVQSEDEDGMIAALDDIKQLAGSESSEWRIAEAKRIVWLVKSNMADKSALVKASELVELVRETRPDWPALLQVQANIFLLKEDVNSAIASLKRALDKQPNNTRLMSQIIALLSLEGRDDEVEKLLAIVDPSQAPLPIRLKWLERNKQYDEAVEALETVVNLKSNNPQLLMQYGELLAKLADRQEDAEIALRRARALAPMLPDTWLSLVRFLADRGKQNMAEAVVREAQTTLSQRQLATFLGKCYQAANLPAEAEESYRVALIGLPDNIELQRELTELYVSSKRYDEAEPILERMLNETRTDRSAEANMVWARRQMARVLASKGGYREFRRARELLEQNKPADGELSEDDAVLYLQISAARPDNDSRRQAVRRIQQVRDSKKRELTANEVFFLAQLHEKLDDWTEADRLIKDLIQSGTSNRRVLEMYISWLLERNEIREASMWRTNLPANSAVRIKAETEILMRNGKTDQARKQIAKLIPKKVTANTHRQLRDVAVFMERLEQYDPAILSAAEKIMRKYVEMVPSRRLDLAEFLSRRDDLKKLNEAIAISQEMLKDEANRAAALEVAVSTLRLHDDKFPPQSPQFKKVASWFPVLRKRFPDSPDTYMPKAELEALRGNSKAVIETYREFLKRTDLKPRHRAVIQNNLSFALSIAGDSREALKLINEAIDYLGPTGDLLDTRAMAHLAAKDPDRAIDDLNQAISQIGESGERLFHLALAQDMKGEKAVAEETLNQAEGLGLNEKGLSIEQRPLYRRLSRSLKATGQVSR